MRMNERQPWRCNNGADSGGLLTCELEAGLHLIEKHTVDIGADTRNGCNVTGLKLPYTVL